MTDYYITIAAAATTTTTTTTTNVMDYSTPLPPLGHAHLRCDVGLQEGEYK